MARRSILNDLTEKLIEAQQYEQECQREYDLADERLIRATAQVIALTAAVETAKPKRRARKEKASS